MHSFREIINYINSLETDEQIKEFVMARYNELEKNSQKRTIDRINEGRLVGSINEGYINSESPIISSYLVDPFYMNDPNLYFEFIKFIKGKDFSNPLALFHEFQNFSTQLFGFKGNQSIRENVYLQERDKDISIADFYNNNSALCSERSATIQNLATFCGLSSYLIIGKLGSQGREEEHAYNIFKMNDGTLVLFDVTNPVALAQNYAPAYSIIGKEDINNIETIAFDFDNLSKLYNLPIHPEEIQDRNYITCNLYLRNDGPHLK